jgi:hypothetical protein
MQFFIISMLSQQLQGQLRKQRSLDSIKYIRNKQKLKDKSNRASSGTSTVGKLLLLPYSAKIIRIIGARKLIKINNKIFL